MSSDRAWFVRGLLVGWVFGVLLGVQFALARAGVPRPPVVNLVALALVACVGCEGFRTRFGRWPWQRKVAAVAVRRAAAAPTATSFDDLPAAELVEGPDADDLSPGSSGDEIVPPLVWEGRHG